MRNKRDKHRGTLLCAWILMSLTSAASAADTSSIERRLDEIERRQNDAFIEENEGKGKVKTFLRDNISVGGFFENGVSYLTGRSMTTQYSVNSNVFGLNLAAQFNEKMRFVSQVLVTLQYPMQNLHNDPRYPMFTSRQFALAGQTFFTTVTQGYVEYSFSPGFNIQSGLGYVPFGYAFQQRELVLFKRRGGPQMMNTQNTTSAFGSNLSIGTLFWGGVHVHGSFPVADNRIGYNVYTITPLTNVKTMGLGSRLWYKMGDYLTVGLSGMTGKLLLDSFQTFGGDINFNYDRFGVTLEYARSSTSNDVDAPHSYYIEPYVSFFDGKLIVYGVADYFDNPTNRTALTALVSVADPYQLLKIGGGINWLPVPYTRFRLGYLVNNYVGDTAIVGGRERRYNTVDLSVGIAF